MGRNEIGLTVHEIDALKAPVVDGEPPDLVFVDPPYELIAAAAPALFVRLGEMLQSKPDALVVFEMPGESELAPTGWTCRKRLGKGGRQPTAAFFQQDRA
jgi:16S rRNA (guanine966-N2)-methyltransferase